MSPDLRRLAARGILPLISAALFIFAVTTVIQPGRTRAEPPMAPPSPAATSALAGVGIVEPRGELIALATELPGVVRQVRVMAGDRVQAGQTLLVLDQRAAASALAAAQADAASAQASVEVARAALADERQRLSLFETVDDPRALSADELARRRFAVQRAQAGYGLAQAQAQAVQAVINQRATDLARLSVTAPIDGQIYRVNIRPGEFAPAGPTAEPLIALGEDGRLQVRVEFDEADAGRLRTNGRAVGALRGAPDILIPLTFERVEPQLVDKRALAGGSERVDTRVIEVIYSFDPATASAYLGQRMDVFVGDPARAAARPAS